MILLDTHVLVWLALDPSRISKSAHSAINQARQQTSGLAISDISLVEVARLAIRGRINFNVSVESFLSEVEHLFLVLPISASIALQAYTMPTSYPNDPVDRIIGATALVKGLSLLTADREIRDSGVVPTIW